MALIKLENKVFSWSVILNFYPFIIFFWML